MKFTRELPTTLMIRSVSAEGIHIGDEVYARPIALTTNEVLDSWAMKDIGDLAEGDFSVILDKEPEVIVLGTGQDTIFAPRELVFAMARRQIGFEVMDTAAAARTYNVLASEGRQVAAVLYI